MLQYVRSRGIQIVNVPPRDITDEEFAAFPIWLQRIIAESNGWEYIPDSANNPTPTGCASCIRRTFRTTTISTIFNPQFDEILRVDTSGGNVHVYLTAPTETQGNEFVVKK